MDDAIRQLRLMCRSLDDDPSEAAAVATRFGRLARTVLAERYGTALNAVFGGHSDVYVLRHVETSTAIASYDAMTDAALAEIVGGRMAASVARTIQGDAGDGSNLVRFASEAEFVAQFVAALADGTAWERWYFFPFSSLRDLPLGVAVRTVLVDNRPALPAILAALERTGHLDRVCRVTGPRELAALWAQGHGPEDGATPDALRPLFAAAASLIDRLEIWAAGRPSIGVLDALFDAYLQTAPSAAVWTDRRGLALVVLEIVRFLATRGVVRLADGDGRLSSGQVAALGELDWLDTDYVALHLPKVLAADQRRRAPPVRELTPRQERIAAELRELLTTGRVVLDGADPAGVTNRVRLFASLVDRLEPLADDAFARTAVESLLIVWARIVLGDRAAVLDRLRRGRVDAAAEGEFDDAVGSRALRFVVAMFGSRGAADVLASLLARAASGQTVHRVDAPASATPDVAPPHSARCAGVFLLSRAVLDVHMPAAVSTAAADTDGALRLDMVLAALGARWGGVEAITDGAIDDGVAAFAGLPAATRFSDLSEQWAAVSDAAVQGLQEAVFKTLAAIRAIGGGVLHLYQMRADSGSTLLFGGPESGDIWPLVAIVDEQSVAPVVRRWVDLWAEALGQPPIVVDPQNTDQSELLRALDAISAGQLRVPAVDLTIGSIGLSLLRVWARWLGHFAESTAPYLLERFVRRSGYIEVDDAGIVVTLAARPLDIVIEMAGYTDIVPRVPWLNDRRLRFTRAVAP